MYPAKSSKLARRSPYLRSPKKKDLPIMNGNEISRKQAKS